MGEPIVIERDFKRTITIVDRVCDVCDKPFQGPESRHYCSMPCRRKAAYERRKQQLLSQGKQPWDPARTEHVDWSQQRG